MARHPIAPLAGAWVLVDGLPVYHRSCSTAGEHADVVVHVHGFGISGTYLEPTAALLAPRYRTYVPDLPGMGRSVAPARPLDLPGLASALVSYCDAVGVERATFVGNSLGCPLIVEVASSFPERIERAVLVSPAGGPNNQPLGRALRQMALDGLREPLSMLPIAIRDYLRFGVLRSWSLFQAMIRYPTLERLRDLVVPTLVIAGSRDPLVDIDRAFVFADLPHVEAVKVPGAHALNYSRPALVAALVEALLTGRPPETAAGADAGVERIAIRPRPPEPGRADQKGDGIRCRERPAST
jgi:pimeloyl-ACP methyl ester carboxylesterase